MITPEAIKTKAIRKYKAFLQAKIQAEDSFFPLIIPANKQVSKELIQFQREMAQLVKYSKAEKGFGYTVDFQKRQTKKYGLQSLPQQIYFESEKDYLQFLGKEKEVAELLKLHQIILHHFPELEAWALQYPLKLISYLKEWDDLLRVLHYFKQHPQPNLYIRELPIEVHTKFIEQHKKILRELLEIVIAPYVHENAKTFEQRFHLKYAESLIRFRILDEEISQYFLKGIDDLAVSISIFQQLDIPIKKVFIVENKTTFLTFPQQAETMVIFGSGFKVGELKVVTWLKDKIIKYWGDIDVQGLQILAQVRMYFPQTESFLMDRETFDQFQERDRGTPSKVNMPSQLTPAEQQLYQLLQINNLRLEQEKIPQWYVLKILGIK